MRILIADDDPAFTLLLERICQLLGHEVVAVGNGAKAWEAYQRQEFPIVVTDWMMPGMDGLELCRKIRSLHRLGYTYVLMLTCREGREDRLEALRAGVDDFLSKPLDREELMARLAIAERVLETQQKLASQNRELTALSAALRESEARYRMLVEHGSDVITVVDADGVIRYTSPSVRRILGHDPDEMRGRNGFELVHPDDLERIRAIRDERVEIPGITSPVELRCRHADGSWRTLEAVANNQLHEPGINGILISSRDISDRKEAERSLEHERTLLRTLIDSLPDYIYVKDAEGRYVVDNLAHQQLLGASSREEVVGKTVFDFFPEELAAQFHADDRSVICSGEALLDCEEAVPTPTRGERWVSTTKVPFRDRSGAVIGVVCVSRDITERRQAEENLKRLLTWQEAIIEGSRDAIFISNAESRFIMVNQAACALTGYSKEELLAMQIADLHEKVDLEAYRRYHHRIMSGEEIVSEAKILRKDGTKVDTEFNSRRVIVSNTPFMHTVARDITERKRAEEALRESEAKFRALAQTAKDAIIGLDEQGRIAIWNEAATGMFGYSEAEVLGEELHTLIVPEEYRRKAAQGLERFLKTGSGPVIGKTQELTALRKDGSLFPIELSISSAKSGDSWRATGIVRDITERKQADEELRRAHAEIEQLLSSISSILIGVDEKDQITRWNSVAEDAFGKAAEEVVGRPLGECNLGWDWPAILQHISDCRLSQRVTRLDSVRYSRPDGKEGFLSLTFSPIRAQDGFTSGYLILGTDVTERKFLESQLAQAQKLESIGQLAAGIAHEINTPTQYVGDNIRFLRDAFADLRTLLDAYGQLIGAARVGSVSPEAIARIESAVEEADLEYLCEEVPKAIEQSLEGVNRVATIVRAMKEFSHPGVEEKTATDLNRAIDSTITVARNEWKYVADVVTDFDPDLPLVPCLAGEFNQVILNIIINAAHAIAEVVGEGGDKKGTITVSTRRDGEWVEVRIRDTGTGIPEEHRAKVFDPFFTTKEVGKGTGQGLAIAHSVIVRKHGGSIRFETEPGKGTTFIIRLPVKAESSERREAA